MDPSGWIIHTVRAAIGPLGGEVPESPTLVTEWKAGTYLLIARGAQVSM